MHTKQQLAALACTLLVSFCAATGGGNALFFDHQKSARAKLSTLTTLSSGFSIAYWVKFHFPANSAQLDFTGFSGNLWTFASDSNEHIVHCAKFGPLSIDFFASATAFINNKTDDLEWHHHGVTYTNSTGVLQFFEDGVLKYTSAQDDRTEVSTNGFSAGQEITSRGHFVLGSSYLEADTAFTGSLDEFCVWNGTVDEDVLLHVMHWGCSGASLASTSSRLSAGTLVGRYGFDNVNKSQEMNLLNSVTGEYDGTITQPSDCVGVVDFGVYPVVVESSAPLQSDQSNMHVLVRANASTSVVGGVLCHGCVNVTVVEIPGLGSQLWVVTNATGAHRLVNVGDVLGVGDGAGGEEQLVFVCPGNATVGQHFSLSVSFASTLSIVKFVVNGAPSMQNFTVTILQNDVTALFLPIASVSVDDSGSIAHSRVEWLDCSSSGAQLTLFQFVDSSACDSEDWSFDVCVGVSENIVGSFPAVLEDTVSWRIGVQHQGMVFGEGVCQLGFSVSDGLGEWSHLGVVTIDVEQVNAHPQAHWSNISIAEDTSVVVSLGASDQENNTIFTTISALPTQGQLYQLDADGNKGQEIVFQSTTTILSQWVESATASSSWPDPINAPETMIGPADVFPHHGDLANAWQPSIDGDFVHSWIELNFSTPVFAQTLDVYETWSPGSVVKVSAFIEATQTWEELWSGESMISLLNPDPTTTKAMISTINLCPSLHATRRFRLDLDLVSTQYWVAIDAVNLRGTGVLDSNVVTSESRQVLFVPNSNFNGEDSFKFVVVDCPFYTTSRDLYQEERMARVFLSVASVNDAPQAQLTNANVLDGPSASVNITLQVQDVDNSLAELRLAILSLPESGKLFVGTEEIKSVPVFLDQGVNVVRFTPSALSKTVQSQTVSFAFSVTDPQGASSTNSTMVLIESCRFRNYSFSVDSTCSFGSLTRELHYSWPLAQQACVGYDLGVETTSCDHIPFNSALGVGLVIVSALVISYCLAWGVWLTINREAPIVRAAQYLFCVLFVLGAAIVCVSNILALGPNEDFLCMARPWFFHLPFTMMFGPLVMKIWRAYQILQNSKLRKRRITNNDVMKWLVMLACVDLVLLILWSGISPLKRKRVKHESSVGVFYNTTCDADNNGATVFVGLLVAYKVALCVGACFLSYQTRNVNPSFAESKHIMFAVYNTGLLGGLIAFVIYATGVNTKSQITLQCLGVNIVAFVSVSVVLIPKFQARKLTTMDLLAPSNPTQQPAVNNASSFRRRMSATPPPLIPSSMELPHASIPEEPASSNDKNSNKN